MLSFNDDECRFIRKVLCRHDWWQNKKIVEKIDDYFIENQNEADCVHDLGEYSGLKTACKKCGSLVKESWSLTNGGFDR